MTYSLAIARSGRVSAVFVGSGADESVRSADCRALSTSSDFHPALMAFCRNSLSLSPRLRASRIYSIKSLAGEAGLSAWAPCGAPVAMDANVATSQKKITDCSTVRVITITVTIQASAEQAGVHFRYHRFFQRTYAR